MNAEQTRDTSEDPVTIHQASLGKSSGIPVVSSILFILCILMAAGVGYFYYKSTHSVATRAIYPNAPTSQSAALVAQTNEIMRSQDHMLSVILAVLGIAATVVTVIVVFASVIFERQYRTDIEEISRQLNAEKLSRVNDFRRISEDLRVSQETLFSQYGNSLTEIGRVESSVSVIRARLEYTELEMSLFRAESSIASKQYTLAINVVRSVLARLMNEDPNPERDSLMLMTCNQILKRIPGSGVARSEFAEVLWLIKPDDDPSRWAGSLRELEAIEHTIVKYVGPAS